MTATGTVPVPPIRGRRVDLFRPGVIARTLLTAAIVALLVYYVGFAEIGTTILKVVVAVALSMGLIVGLNLLFNMVYDRWTVFLTNVGLVIGFLTFLILDGNRVLRDLDPRPWAWAAIGGVATATVLFVQGAVRDPVPKLWLGLAGFGGLGALLAVAVADPYQPALDWTKLLICTGIGAALGGLSGLRHRTRPTGALGGALVGGALGWLIGAWGGADFGDGSIGEALVATVVPGLAIGARFGMSRTPDTTTRRRMEEQSRAWIFVGPALLILAAGLVVPLVRTVILSFKDRNSEEYVGWTNYGDVIFSRRPAVTEEFIDATGWFDRLIGSRLFWAGIAIVGVAIVVGVVAGRSRRQAYAAEAGTVVPMLVGFFLVACAVFATVRGTLSNNLWWIVVVTSLATAFGLAVAVLADRARGENVAKSMIFLPMAISFIGAGIIWRFMYVTRNVNDPQTGLLNAIWVGLGELSNSGWQKWLVAAVMILIIIGLLALARRAIADRNGTRAGFAIGFAMLLVVLTALLLGPGIGGFEVTDDGEVRAQTIDFIRESPYNNMWLMVVLIWLQTGFAMVIFSSAIKAVPVELTEAAKIDGANESQVFWKVTLPQIGPTIAVVTTTLIVVVLKVFDIVRVTTGGQFGTQVIANQMANAVSDRNAGIAATLATLLFIGVLPVMFYNLRNLQRAES
jgi:alpha-glucoside transport system permease protein